MKTALHSILPFNRSRKQILLLLLAVVCIAGLQAQTSFNEAEYFFDTDPGIGSGNTISVPFTPDSVTISLPAISTTGLGTGKHTLFVRSRTDGIKWSLYEGSSFFIKPSITFAEYFIDTDPGVGNGTQLPVTAGEDSISVSTSITTGILSGGTHRLYIRTRDNAGNYSLHEGQPFFVISGTTLAAAEWFIDTDPGIGNGTPLTIIGVDSASFTGAVVTPNNLTGGTHFLYVRAKTQTGLWGLYEPKPFYVTTQTTLAAAEWFIDTDPGIGNGTALSINGLDSASFTGSIVTPNNLTGGTHFLYVRAKTQTGKWGLYEPKPFFVTSQTTISAAEWFIDTDPGIGNGTALSINGLDSASYTGSIVTPNNLTGGTHFLYVRAKTLTGKWGLYEPKPFFVNLATTINAAEYFIDTDPGIGNGTPVAVNPGLDSITGSAAIVIPNNLKAGNHYLYLRTRSLPGKWSLYEGRKFTVKPSIVAAEYFVDNDPGIGNANPITITPGFDSVTVNTTMATACLSSGEHYVYVRTKDSNGNWGLYEPDTINVTGTAPVIFTPGNDTICLGDSVTLTLNANTACSLQWLLNSNPIVGATNTTYVVHASGSYQLKQTIGGIDYVSNALSITVLPTCAPSVWTGNSSTDWFSPGNWNTGVVPNTCNSDVIIPTTPTGGVFPVINIGAPQVHDITVQNGATITINTTHDLSVCGNWTGGTTTASSITGTGSVILSGTATQILSGKTSFQTLHLNNSNGASMQTGAVFNVFVALELESGALNATNGSITLKSTASGTAYLNNFTYSSPGTYIGNLTVERYVASSGTHYIGYPFTSYGLTSTGIAGQVIPQPSCNANATASNSPYSNIYKWNETTNFTSGCSQQGWVAVTNENSVTGKGYAVSLGSNQTLSLSGAPILNDYNYGATKSNYTVPNPTPSAGVFNPSYTQVTGGTNLVSNPFPSPYEWDGGNNANINSIAYVWQTSGTYKGTYQAINPGTVLSIGQGFFVKASGTTNLAFTNANRRVATNPTFYQTNNGANLDITMAGNGFADRTQIVFNDQSTLDFDATLDGFKVLGNYNQPTLYTVLNGNMMACINTLPSIAQSPNVVMGMFVGTSGNYEFTFNNINSFDPTSYIYLEDTKTGTMQDMRADNSYSFAATTSDDPDRFVIHFTPAVEIATINQNCDTLGVIQINQPGTAQWQYTLADGSANTISNGSLNQDSAISVIAPAGTYTLTLVDANNYTVAKSITVGGTTPVTASFTASTDTAETGDAIAFTSTAANATATVWAFGDGSTANTGNAAHIYNTEGTYMVTLTVTNADGCSSSATQTITVTDKVVNGILTAGSAQAIAIWSSENKVYIDFSKQTKVDATIEVYNVLGQQIVNDKFGSSTLYSKQLKNLEAAYLVVRVKNDGGIKVKRVFIAGK